jgi:hypothetical protein
MEGSDLSLEWYQVVPGRISDIRCHVALVNSEWLDNLRDEILVSGGDVNKYLENIPGKCSLLKSNMYGIHTF